jgi:type VI secretion system protein ImpF
MSFLFPGGALPLFDKLGEHLTVAPNETDQALSADGLEASVARELSRLTNSRSRIPLSDFQEATLTVLDYGIPDTLALSALSERDKALISEALERAITVFEPRLTQVEVTVLPSATGKTVARYVIAANLRIAHTVRRINFRIDTGENTNVHSASEAA